MKEASYNAKICEVEDSGAARNLSAAATVSCGRCGAKAHDARNVCDPVQLPQAGMLGD